MRRSGVAADGGDRGVTTDDSGVPPLMLMSEMMETAAAVGFHGGSVADHGGGPLFVSDGSYDDVVLDRVQTTQANRSDFTRVKSWSKSDKFGQQTFRSDSVQVRVKAVQFWFNVLGHGSVQEIGSARVTGQIQESAGQRWSTRVNNGSRLVNESQRSDQVDKSADTGPKQ
ncbi:hypothetical protein Hanom_Chr00s002397g01698521 [Helianthus anomalus]